MYSDQRNAVGSPPLHHPVPQHPIPPFRSPPPPTESSLHGSYQQAVPNNPYIPQANQGAGAGGNANYNNQSTASSSIFTPANQTSARGTNMFGNYGNIFNDPNAQIGIEVGKSALNYGQEYIGRNINQIVTVSSLKYYFQVSNVYVMKKIGLVLFPWTHKPWSRMIQRAEGSSTAEGYCTARQDVNAPDMYIPVMAFTTYILLSSVLAGLHGDFHPEMLGYIATKAIAYMIIELLVLRVGTYLLSAGSKLLDFVAYSGYKFIGITLTFLIYSITKSSAIKWSVFCYTALSNSFFLLRSLRYILLPDTSSGAAHTINSGQRQRRIQFLFFYSFICQFVSMWLLV